MDFSVSFLENLYENEGGVAGESGSMDKEDEKTPVLKSPREDVPKSLTFDLKRSISLRSPSPKKKMKAAPSNDDAEQVTPRRRSPRKHSSPIKQLKPLEFMGPSMANGNNDAKSSSPSNKKPLISTESNNGLTESNAVAETSQVLESTPPVVHVPISVQQVNCIRYIVTTARPTDSSWTGVDEYVTDVVRVLERTIVFGENQSALLVASAGNGKRVIVEKALNQLKAKQESSFHTIHLSGSVLLNETEAFREIVQQLAPDGIIGQRSISFFNMYDFLKQLLLEKALAEESVLFIVDDFDAFVGESKQLLLYNILDWMQSKDVRIGLLGLSCNFNVLAQFEKRVKSRFSNIQILVPRHPLKVILQLLWTAFQLPREKWPSHVPIPSDTFFDQWETSLHRILLEAEHGSHWQYLYDMGKPLEVFVRLMYIAIAGLTTESPYITEQHIQNAFSMLYPCHAMHALRGLTTREMTLVLGMIGLDRQGKQNYSFEMVFHECKAFYRQHALKCPPRIDLLKALDNLLALQVVQEFIHQPQPEYCMVKLMVRPLEVLDAIRKKKIICTTLIEQWAMNTLQ